MSRSACSKGPRGLVRIFLRRARRWRRRASTFTGTPRGLRSLVAILAASLSVYRVIEGWTTTIAVIGLALFAISLGICLVAIWPTQVKMLLQAIDHWTGSVLDSVFGFAEARLRQLTVLTIALAITLSIVLWGWLIEGSELRTETQETRQTVIRTDITETGSTTVRNLSLVLAALLALPIAIWRTRVAQLQATTAQRELFDSLYRQGDLKLRSEDLSVRLDGVHILDRLAKDEPDRYHIQIMGRLCAFLRSSRKVQEEHNGLQEDERAVVESIRSRESAGRDIEDQSSFTLDLNSTNLKGVWFNSAVLSRADLSLTCLEEAKLNNADLSEVVFYRANLKGAGIYDSELTGAKFSLDGRHPATGLTQEQLDNAWSEKENLPALDGVVDAVTGRQLTPPKRRMSIAKEMEQWRLEIKQMLDER